MKTRLRLPLMKNVNLNQVDVTMTKPSIEYAFLEGTDKLPVIISKELKDEEKAALLKVLKSHKRAITWKISDIKGIDPSFCTHKILIEDDGNEYSLKDKNKAKTEKTKHENGKSVKSQQKSKSKSTSKSQS
ncbi:hypothetical protein Tco_0717264 [Tanacetum coccineum]